MKGDTKRKEKELGYKSGSFGSKKIRKDQNCVDSNPYVEENNEKVNGPIAGSPPRGKEPGWNDNLGYFIKKVTDDKKSIHLLSFYSYFT